MTFSLPRATTMMLAPPANTNEPATTTYCYTVARDPSVVARGNEKVIRARLADAKFFFKEDSKVPLDQHFEKLHKVVFHSQLGTSYEKVMHFRQLADFISAKIRPVARGEG